MKARKKKPVRTGLPPSPSEVIACANVNSWTRVQLEYWGLKYPPKTGWRIKLHQDWLDQVNKEKPTLDFVYRLQK